MSGLINYKKCKRVKRKCENARIFLHGDVDRAIRENKKRKIHNAMNTAINDITDIIMMG
jgi:hypothetical protein